jgi:hypothetical protein
MSWRALGVAFALLVTAAGSIAALAQDAPPAGFEVTPPRLSYLDGKISFLRPGAEDWAPARVNTALAPGDALYTDERANLEIQIGPRAFSRAAGRTELTLVSLEPDFLQLKLTAGQASLDMRSLPASHTVELDTPNAVFTIEQPGYYRAEVNGDETHFITRRGGRATVTVVGWPSQAIAPSEEVIVRGATAPAIETYVAPPLDAWDRWNYARTDHEIEALSGRYVSAGVYGVGDLDYYGTWRVVATYGPVWVPYSVAPGWAPYTIGSWIWDPRFGWTWIDDAPWGWAPYHHGRWVLIGSYWAWAPGPVIVRPLYAPALVAFFGVAPGVSVRIGIGAPAVAWVALGWGEPLRPWWGPPGFIGKPWWGGWGGPRVVNNVVIQRTTVVDVRTIVYRHSKTPRAVVAVRENEFGGRPVRPTRFSALEPRELEHIRDAHPVRPGPASLTPVKGPAARPPASVTSRPVVTTRPPREAPQPWQRDVPAVKKPPAAAPAPRVVAPPKRPEAGAPLPRPSFGEKGRERPRPPQAPRLEDVRRAPPPVAQKAPVHTPRTLPGRPANEQFPRSAAPPTKAPQKAPPGGHPVQPAQKAPPGAHSK